MDISSIVNLVAAKIKSDPTLLASFQSNPAKTIEKISGIDIPDALEPQITQGVRSALSGGNLSGLADTLKNLF